MEYPLSICFGCGSKENLKKCGECTRSDSALMVPSYCGRACQVKDWAVHKYICAKNDGVIEEAWRLQTNGDGVDVIVAKRDIPPGRIVFQRKPLLAFPDPSSVPDADVNILTGLKETRKFNPMSNLPACLSCHEVMSSCGEASQDKWGTMRLNKCKVCKWPIHSGLEEPTSCETVHQHECGVILAAGLTWDEAIKIPGFAFCLGLLRAWLLPEDKKKQLLDMSKPTPEMTSLFLQSAVAETMKFFMLETCGIAPKDPMDLENLMIAIVGNVLPAMTQWNVMDPQTRSFVIFEGGPTGRVLSHDCVPNCAVYVSDDLRGTFRTIKKVHKDETLTISLIGEQGFFNGVSSRTESLLKLFSSCACRRCTSQDEDGTFLSALRTNDCGEGEYYLPKRVNSGYLFTWECSSTKRNPVLSQSDVNALAVDSGSLPPDSVFDEERTPLEDFEFKKQIIKSLEKSGTFNEHSEWVLMAKVKLADIAVTLLCAHHDFELDLYKKYLEPVETAIDIYDKLGGGRSRYYGQFLMAKGFLQMAQLAEEIEATKGLGVGIEEVDNRAYDAIQNFEEGLKIWNIWNPCAVNPCTSLSNTSHAKNYGYQLLQNIDRYYAKNAVKLHGQEGVKCLRKRYGKDWNAGLKKELEWMRGCAKEIGFRNA